MSIVVDITEISAIFAAVGVLIGVVLTVLELRNIVRARHGELFLDLYDHYNNPAFVKCYSDVLFNWTWKNYEDWKEKYGTQNIEAYSFWASTGNYFKGVGVLVDEKLIDVRLVDKLMGEPFLRYWEKCEPIIKEFRRDHKMPKAWETAEHLYNELKKREQLLQRGVNSG